MSLSVLVSVVGTLALAPSASANHHFMSIREVFAGGTSATEAAEFVELQMYFGGQNVFVGNNPTVTLFDAAGTATETVNMNSMNPPNGADQATVLLANPAASLFFSNVVPDFPLDSTDDLDRNGGAVCFTSTPFMGIDCVGWGTLVFGSPPSPIGTLEPGPITNGASLERSIAGAPRPTMLDMADDTNNSDADFAPDATPSPCANTSIQTTTVCNTQLQVLIAPSGTGSVAGNGPIACPPTCTATYGPALTAALTATANAGSTFINWTNCPMPSGVNCNAPMDQSRTITANFTTPPGGGGGGTSTTTTPTDNFDLPAAKRKCKRKFPTGAKRTKCIKKAKEKEAEIDG